MKYALLVYDAPASWHNVPSEQRHGLHEQYQAAAGSSGVIAHYALRPPQRTTSVRFEEGRVVTSEGPLADTREHFRALYLIESDDDGVLEFAAQIPAARRGGVVEVWPLIERQEPVPEVAYR